MVITISRDLVERFRACTPTVISAYSLLLHVHTNLYEISRNDVINMMHSPQYITGGILIMIGNFFRTKVIPLVRVGQSLFRVKIFDRVGKALKPIVLSATKTRPFPLAGDKAIQRVSV